MNKRQKIVQEQFINNEEAVIKRLKAVYKQSLKDIEGKALELQNAINSLDLAISVTEDAEELARLQSMKQSKVYQKQYQDALKKQVGSILDNMQVEEFKTVSEYLNKCYEDGFIGTMYDLQGQGIPLCFPLDQESMVRAVQLDSKISQGLYTRLGEDVSLLKKKITAQVSRGISTGMSYSQVAQQLAGYTNIGFNNAVRIARTEGHRIQTQATMDACYKAKDRGADIVKQWDSTLDARTRDSHTKVDGEIRELGKKFSNGLMFPGDPSGRASEVVNCRCALLQRAKWALDEAELKTLQDRAEYFGLDKAEEFENYKQKYLKAVEKESAVTEIKSTFTPSASIKEAEDFIKNYVDDSGWAATGVSYSGISVETANAVNKTLSKLYDTFDIDKLGGVFVAKGNTKLGKAVEGATAAYSPVRKSLLLNNRAMKNVDDIVKSHAKEVELIKDYAKNPSAYTFKTKRGEAVAKASIKSGRATVPDTIDDVIHHEMGHHIESVVMKSDDWATIKASMSRYAENISGYATISESEYIAESFASYLKGEGIVDPKLADVFKNLKRSKTSGIIDSLSSEKNYLEKFGNSGIIISEKQFGKKIGKHAKDFNLDVGLETDRQKMREIIDDIITNCDEKRTGNWRGQTEQVTFYIKGDDVVLVSSETNQFISILKGGVTNERVKNAGK